MHLSSSRAFKAALCVAALFALTAHAQTQDNPQTGRVLFEDTPDASGVSNLTGACTSCHGTVQNRRIRIGGSAFADIAFDTALARFTAAVQGIPAMQQFGALSAQQMRDIAAYLADTPKTSVLQLDFGAAAVNTPTTAQPVDLRSAVATSAALRIESVAIGGSGAARFTRTTDACDQQTLAAGSSCRIAVRFSAPDTSGHQATLTLSLREGSAASFTRVVALSGAIAVSAPPPGAGPVAGAEPDGGGGALGWPWLALLALATGALARNARRRDGD